MNEKLTVESEARIFKLTAAVGAFHSEKCRSRGSHSGRVEIVGGLRAANRAGAAKFGSYSVLIKTQTVYQRDAGRLTA
jgi:hypothetical protein